MDLTREEGEISSKNPSDNIEMMIENEIILK